MIKIFGKLPEEIEESIFLSSASDMKKADADCAGRKNISFSELMEKAAEAAFNRITAPEICGFSQDKKITVLCGSGNNGGDGYVMSLLFAGTGARVCVINVFGEPQKSGASLFHYNRLAGNPRVKILNSENLSDGKLQEIISDSDIIIDAVFGTGFRGKLSGNALRVIKSANREANSAVKIAVDVPSGIDCDSGEADPDSFGADLTVTFEFIKRGMISYPAAEYTGDIEVVSIGFEKETRDIITGGSRKSVLLSSGCIKKILRAKNGRTSENTNKSDFGRLLAVCGSENMTGAAYFAAMGALRTGVGLVYLASGKKTLEILQTKLNEPVFVPMEFGSAENIMGNIKAVGADAVLIGPGLGIENSGRIINILKDIRDLPETIIFDADGINALCGNINILHEIKTQKALTPHPGEMARLCAAAGFGGINSPADVQKNRISLASEFAQKYNCTLALKGANTVIADADGDIYVNITGNSGMSKGGSGDILAGMAASYCAQKKGAVNAVCAAVYLHGLAGDIAARRYSRAGMIPSDMLNIIAEIQK